MWLLRRANTDRLWCVLLPASQILQDSVNLLFFAESLKERQQVQELCVIHVVKPGLDWDLERGKNLLHLIFVIKIVDVNMTTETQTVIKLNWINRNLNVNAVPCFPYCH